MVNPEIAAKAAAAVVASKQFWRAFGLKMWSVADAIPDFERPKQLLLKIRKRLRRKARAQIWFLSVRSDAAVAIS